MLCPADTDIIPDIFHGIRIVLIQLLREPVNAVLMKKNIIIRFADPPDHGKQDKSLIELIASVTGFILLAAIIYTIDR